MRYELVLFKNNSEEVVSFTINGKETTKVGLNFLDVMTTNFENEAELLRFLKEVDMILVMLLVLELDMYMIKKILL